ncbi:MAG: peptidylprolyl isomerase [Fimbriimonas sp.]|nr:peptidylprolyl isomerase [Fimbriimonas sp.]
MRPILSLLLVLIALPRCLAQSYTPKAGETVVKIGIEGRGNVYVLLHMKEAPRTSARIAKLVGDGFYNGQRFHRVEQVPKPYLVQIGDPGSRTGDLSATGNGGTGVKIQYEDSGFKNVAGAVGLARGLEDKNSGDCQFYMLLDRSSFLDGNYTVFGQVVAGMEVLKKIQWGDRVLSMTIERGSRAVQAQAGDRVLN